MVNAAEDVAPQRRKDGVTLGTRSSRHAGACEAGRPVARRRHSASDLRNAPAREILGHLKPLTTKGTKGTKSRKRKFHLCDLRVLRVLRGMCLRDVLTPN